MSYYVSRQKRDYNEVHGALGPRKWIGPIRSEKQAQRERQAWEDAGFASRVYESDAEIRSIVRSWQRHMDIRHGRTR